MGLHLRAKAARHRTDTPSPPPSITDGGSELSTALHCVSEFGQWIRNADAKTGALVAVHGLVLTVLAGELSHSEGPPAMRWYMMAGFLSCVAASAVAIGCLFGTQLPRVNTPDGPGPSALAFPAVAAWRPGSNGWIGGEDLSVQAWRQAGALAGIAIIKYRWLRRATLATAATLATFLFWTVLSMVLVPKP
jgi:hypothetical protein